MREDTYTNSLQLLSCLGPYSPVKPYIYVFKLFPDELDLFYLLLTEDIWGQALFPSTLYYPVCKLTGIIPWQQGNQSQKTEKKKGTSDLVALPGSYLLQSSCLNGSYAENRWPASK